VTAPNHALTGALIGLTITNPALALPLAFLSHFACDAIPHYDPAERDASKLYGSKRFEQMLWLQAAVCGLIVLLLESGRPQHWVAAAIGAFLAASPDFFWIPMFLKTRRTGRRPSTKNWFLRFHAWVQWRTGPKWAWLEAAWFIAFGALLIAKL